MVLDLGPCPADEVARWVRFSRRIIAQLRSVEAEGRPVAPDMLALWSRTLDEWETIAERAAARGEPFRWTTELELEVAEYLLHGLDQCLHSERVRSWVTESEAAEQRPFTNHVVRAFADGLATEGSSGQHLADQVLGSLPTLLAESE